MHSDLLKITRASDQLRTIKRVFLVGHGDGEGGKENMSFVGIIYGVMFKT
jgi:hypothetical protein